MSGKNVTEDIMAFIEERDWTQFHSPRNLAAALSVEAGELLEHFIWKDPSFSELARDEREASEVRDEVADVLIYAFEMCRRLETTPEEVIRTKMAKNSAKYPVHLARGSAEKYDRLGRSGKGKKNAKPGSRER